MPKPLVENRIIYGNIYGRVKDHDEFLNQGVKTGDSPTFANLLLTGDANIEGNLYVRGNATVVNSNVVEFEDNILLVNSQETGAGVTLNQSGIEIKRGTYENYRVVYNESDETFKVGFISNLQPVALREASPMPNGIMMWNAVTKRIEARNLVTGEIGLTSTMNATSATSASFYTMGGIGVSKDIWTNGKLLLCTSGSVYIDSSDNMVMWSVNDINFNVAQKIGIPYNKKLVFGGDNSIWFSANSLSKDLNINVPKNINFTLSNGQSINLPNGIPITFSTQNEKVYADSSNNMVIAGNRDIILNPGDNNGVFLPVNIPMLFGNGNQRISSNLANDLTVVAGNNILLSPGPTLDVRIPTDNGIKFGNSGSQRISSDSNNDLYITAANNILFSSNSLRVPGNVPLTFGSIGNRVSSNSQGNLQVSSFGGMVINASATSNATSGTSGSLSVRGGLGVVQDIFCNGTVFVDQAGGLGLCIQKGGVPVFSVGTQSIGRIDTNAEIMNFSTPSYFDATTLIGLTAAYDSTAGYNIGRGRSTDRSMTINVPSYTSYNLSGARPKLSITSAWNTELLSVESDTGNIRSIGAFQSTNAQNAQNATSASFVIWGGLGIVKDTISNGDYCSYVDSPTAVLVSDASGTPLFEVNTQNYQVAVDGKLDVQNGSFSVDTSVTSTFPVVISNSNMSNDLSSGALVVSGETALAGQVRMGSGLNMSSTSITNLANPISAQDAATKAYVDLVKQGLYVKDSVSAATTAPDDLNNFIAGAVVDSYTLAVGDRILIKDQGNAVENGVWVVSAGSAPPTRSTDLPTGTHASGTFVFVKDGSVNKALGWICNSSSGTDVAGTNSLNFTEFTGLGQVEAGAGLSKVFNTMNVNVDNVSLEIMSDALRIKSSAVSTGITGGSGAPLQTTSDQSHVTKLGTINTGVWQASTVQVFYGGTGKTKFNQGCIPFGAGVDPLGTSSLFVFNNALTRLGVGTGAPESDLHVSNSNDTILTVTADSDGVSPTAKPQILLCHSGSTSGVIGVSRSFDDFAANTYADSLVLCSPNSLQLATGQHARLNILQNGDIGIRTSTPGASLDINGTLTTNDLVSFTSAVESTSPSSGSVVLDGGLGVGASAHVGKYLFVYGTEDSTSYGVGAVQIDGGVTIRCPTNSYNFGNGGALTVMGGGSFGGDLWVSGQVNGSGSSSSTFAYLTLTATDEAINITTGALVTFGGISIQCATNATSVTNGGSFLVNGGGSFGGDVWIGGDENLIGNQNIWKNLRFTNAGIQRFSIDRTTSNDLSVYRYNSAGTLQESSLFISGSTGTMLLSNSTASISATAAALIITGGVSIKCSTQATSPSSGSGLTVVGGVGIGKDLLVGGNAHVYSTQASNGVTSGALVVDGSVGIGQDTNMGGVLTVGKQIAWMNGGLLQSVNNTSGNSAWYYFGTTSSCEIELSCDFYGLLFSVSMNGTVPSYYHCHRGSLTFNSTNKPTFYVYNDGSNKKLFMLAPANGITRIRVLGKTGTPFFIVNEGTGSNPNGASSGFSGAWSQTYATNVESTMSASFANLQVQGTMMQVTAPLPVVGYNDMNTTSSRDLGVLYQRFQQSNDAGTGDIVTDPFGLVDTLPDQTTASSTQLRLSNLASSTDNVYNGCWVKVGTGTNINQVRKITSYNGGQRVAQIDAPWTGQNPVAGDTVYIYFNTYVSTFFDEGAKTFRMVYSNGDADNDFHITRNGDADLAIKHLYASDTTASTNATTGGMVVLGGVSVNSTAGSTSCTSGGGLTCLGGAGIAKDLFVGNRVGIGGSGFTPSESLHIKQGNSTVRLEYTNPTGGSYIDFVGSAARYGILASNNMLSITSNTNGGTPVGSASGITLVSSGNVGICTTSNVSSPLTIRNSSFISADSATGFLGIRGGVGNSNDSSNGGRMVMYGGSSSNFPGDVRACAGGSGVFSVSTSADTERLRVDSRGTVSVFSTAFSKNASSGALVVTGAVAVSSTENAEYYGNGGALTVAGGASVEKDIFIGGNLYINGNLNATGSVLTPTIDISNTVGCTIVSVNNVNLVTVSAEAILSFCVTINPSAEGQPCEFQYALPDRTNALLSRAQLVAMCNGYTDDVDLIPLFNCLSVGVTGTTRGLVKFQSVSTGPHYLTVFCRYTMA